MSREELISGDAAGQRAFVSDVTSSGLFIPSGYLKISFPDEWLDYLRRMPSPAPLRERSPSLGGDCRNRWIMQRNFFGPSVDSSSSPSVGFLFIQVAGRRMEWQTLYRQLKYCFMLWGD